MGTAGLLLATPFALTAQSFQLSGRALAVSAGDTLPLVDHWVTLHQVSLDGGAMIDSSRTNALGIYVLRTAQVDSNALYLASVQYRDITYFSSPLRGVGLSADSVAPLFVYDTSSVEPALSVAQRHIVVRQLNDEGVRPVLELIVLMNRGALTRIAPDSLSPVWRHMLPEGAFALQVGESDVSAEALRRVGNELMLYAPVPPGQKQVVFSYSLPSEGRVEFPTNQPAERLQLLVEDTASTVSGLVARVGTEQMEGLRFARYDAMVASAADPIQIDFGGQPFNPVDYWWVIVVATTAVFATVTVVWWRRVERVPATSDDPDVLAARIALLDENYARERDGMSDGDRTAYENTRASLKARLSTALARRHYQR